MNKLVPDPPVTDLLLLDPPALSLIDPLTPKDCEELISALTLTIDHTTTALLDNPPGDMRDAMGMNIRLLCRLINAVCDHTHATCHDQGATR
ncbi:hypothetical protein LG197_05925 [Pseudomonas asiatica]|uniref:Uncharacterized protein n=1 Tax=Pseudomonas monteilii SB3101 TaxID=1435058 RepID=V9V5P7_9PSED|nr:MULTISPECIES: hypothetical protein [Pseudomonas]AEJ10741.1 conserved hypothetical protein [Pseudomonas putida S16]AHC85471.1 hypothetical protein X969_27000 [Pseudomonas monteilii SB3078]AHC90839.1 hypothetical protein X970_26615 [Pseudomonas monteilii SB3101]KAF4558331.1 hypothetical protein HBJ16_004117 [Pseudomonas sp. CES]MBF8802695.1 hypothetical protein [Pseudomonas asiatica]